MEQRGAMAEAAKEGTALLNKARQLYTLLERDLAALEDGAGDETLERARLWAKRVEQLGEDIHNKLAPACHNCEQPVAFGMKCCGSCFHAAEDDGTSTWSCPLTGEEHADAAE